MGNEMLVIEDLRATVDGKEILRGVTLNVAAGQIHAVMGPNGSGKSTLAYAVMGHPKYVITGGRVLYFGEDITKLSPDDRARKGIFLGFQYPTAIPGVSVSNFLRTAVKAIGGKEIAVKDFLKELRETMKLLQMPEEFLKRYVNDGFSGGEKKRLEILQMLMIKPKLAVLDETDSGLDIDALRVVAEGIQRYASPQVGVLLITHYQRLLNYIKPNHVHVLVGGKIVRSGGPELAHELEAHGYDGIAA